MNFVVDPIWSWPLTALAILALLALVGTTYPPRVRHLRPGTRRLLVGLRVAAVAALAAAMLRPAVEWIEKETKSRVLCVVGDASRSMQTKDAAGGRTRRQALVNAVDDARGPLEKLQEKLDVRYFDFAERLAPVETYENTADGRQTAIGETLQELVRKTRSDRYAGIVLLSDGAQRALPPQDAEPRAMARRLRELRVPVHTVPFGGSGISDAAVDLAVEDLQVDPVVFEKKTVPVSAQVRVLGSIDRDVTVRLLVENREGKQPGESGKLQVPEAERNAKPSVRIDASQSAKVIPVELSYVPRQPGEYKIAVEVESLDGEVKTHNNRRTTILTVRRGGIKVAYFDKPRPEQKFLRTANRSDKIQLDYQQVRAGKFRHLTELDPQMFEPDRYDVYLIGDVPAAVFQQENALRKLAERVDDGAGLLMMGGYHSFGPGGYAGTPLEDVLPVAMNASELQSDEEIATDLHHLRPLQMVPTSRGLEHFVLRIDAPEKNRERWRQLPPLEGANKLRRKNPAVEVLAESEDGVPLLFAHEVGKARVMAFAGDTTWSWALQGHADVHERFWRQVILWLARKEDDADESVWVRVMPRNYRPNRPVDLRFGARDEKGDPIEDANFDVRITDPEQQEHTPAVQSGGSENFAEFRDTRVPGDYWVRVSASRDGEPYGFDDWTRFIVEDRDLELDNPAADPALLQEIAALTGGSSVPPEQLGSLLNQLLEQRFEEEATRTTRLTLWDNWGFLLAFVSLMTAEWFVRKRRGLV